MVFIPSHSEGRNYVNCLARPWVRLRASSQTRFRHNRHIARFLIVVGEMTPPNDDAKILLRFKSVDGRLNIKTLVSRNLQGTDFEYALEILTEYFQWALSKAEVKADGQ